MDFSKIVSWTIPEGDVLKAYIGSQLVWQAPPPPDYVSDGLVLCLDVASNTGRWNKFNSSLNYWQDIVTGNRFTWTGNATPAWSRTGLTLSGDGVFMRDFSPWYSIFSDNLFTAETVAKFTPVAEATDRRAFFDLGGAPWSESTLPAIWSTENRYFSLMYGKNSANNRDIVRIAYRCNGTGGGNGADSSTNGFLATTGDVQNLRRIWNGVINSVVGTYGDSDIPENLPFYIGGLNATEGFFNGTFCALRLYNRSLTAEEIWHNYSIDKTRFNLP